jgi:lysozyme
VTTPQRIDGVDVSHYQNGSFDYDAMMQAGVKWMYHKCTEGNTYKDPNYARRRGEAKDAGLPFGAYHFARPTAGVGDAEAEAKFFIETAKPVPGDLRPALDLETLENLHGLPLVAWTDRFCAEVKRLTGVDPVIYTPYTLSNELEERCVFWVPRYNSTNTPPQRRWDVWQFSNGQYGVPNRVPGIGNCDINTSKVPVQMLVIPKPQDKPAQPHLGKRIQSALDDLAVAEGRAKDGTRRDTLIKRAMAALRKIKPTS